MIKCSKAALRLIREDCGLKQEDLSELLDVRVQIVKRWEKGSNEIYPIPDTIWQGLNNLRDFLYGSAEDTFDAIDAELKESGDTSVSVCYFRFQSSVDKITNGTFIPIGFVNAQARLVVSYLEVAGYDVELVYEEDSDDSKKAARHTLNLQAFDLASFFPPKPKTSRFDAPDVRSKACI